VLRGALEGGQRVVPLARGPVHLCLPDPDLRVLGALGDLLGRRPLKDLDLEVGAGRARDEREDGYR
jgi:hypothetical protein